MVTDLPMKHKVLQNVSLLLDLRNARDEWVVSFNHVVDLFLKRSHRAHIILNDFRWKFFEHVFLGSAQDEGSDPPFE